MIMSVNCASWDPFILSFIPQKLYLIEEASLTLLEAKAFSVINEIHARLSFNSVLNSSLDLDRVALTSMSGVPCYHTLTSPFGQGRRRNASSTGSL